MSDEPVPRDDTGEVFVSYSWDDENHIRRVLELSNRLRSEGVDCVLDQYEALPPEGWPRWMDRKILGAEFVLAVCTETYYRRVMGQEAADTGLGVKWEGGLIYQHLYNAGANNSKFIPVIFSREDRKFIPTPLQGATFYRVDTAQGYEDLYARLLRRTRAEKPPLGRRRPLSKKEVKTDVTAYIVSPIDVPLWDAAGWKGVIVMVAPEKIPLLGLGFLNEIPATKIFEEWRRQTNLVPTG